MAPAHSSPGVYIQEVPAGARAIAGASTSVTAFLGTAPRGPVGQPMRILGPAGYEAAFGGPDDDTRLGCAVRLFFLNGGIEAWVLRVEDESAPTQRPALDMLRDVDFNLLCLPGITRPDVLAEAAACCEARHAFLIADAPASAMDAVSMAQAAAEGALPASSHAAVYFPWIYVSDPRAAGARRLAPPCGAIAGLYARSDAERGVWTAPAGTGARLAGVESLAAPVTDGDNRTLNPLGVNCLRVFPGHGLVCWGARTLRGADGLASEYKYVPVRRLALYLERSLRDGTQWAAFEPNDEPLWAQVRLSAGDFMHGLFRQGAFQGSAPRDAYFVKCDRETTTRNDIDNGSFNIVAGFAALKPAEFVIIRIRQSAGPISA